VHSERSDHHQRSALSSLYGLQCWVALPQADEECEPDFTHLKADELPVAEGEGTQLIMIAGSFLSLHSPLPTRSPLFYAQLRLSAGASQLIPAEYEERAIYIVSGDLDLGSDGSFNAGQLVVLKPHHPLTVTAGGSGATVMLLGGEPMDGPRHLVWNFVSSSEERIEQAKRDWIAQRFAPVPEETEWIPLPDNLKPADYP
jgi:redox-sensitive bicupin YhaK (pirin superfamily)